MQQADKGADPDQVAVDQAAELLRLSLPLMSRHRVPATPQNYAVWYSYVARDNPELNAEVDRLIADQTPFSADINTQLYRRFVAEHDVDNIEQVRAGLRKVLSEVGSSLTEAGNDAEAYGGALGGIVTEVGACRDPHGLKRLLEALVEETRAIQSATHGMQQNFESKSKEVEELQEQLERERRRATTDPLTGLYNRFALFDQMHAAIGEMGAGEPPSLIMLDIDKFKVINDTHGHLIGDRVIRFVAQTMQNNIKGKDSAARYGGEEFTVLLPSTPSQGAAAVAETIRKAIAAAQLVRADNKKPLGQITVSAGVTTYRPGEDLAAFINRADQALYRSKQEGRNRISVG